MKFEVGKLYQLVSTPRLSITTVETYPDEAIITKEHNGKNLEQCGPILSCNFEAGPFLVVANNESSVSDKDFYRIVFGKGNSGWVRLPKYVENWGWIFKELKDNEV